MLIPSYVLVPRPNSSKSTKERGVTLLRMFEASVISTIKVDSPNEMLSEAPTRVKILSTIPMRARSAGTKQPICANSTIRAVCRNKADLPAIFGPVIIIICWCSVSSNTSLGTYCSPIGNCVSITGWRPCLMSNTSESSTTGRT